jgi:sulfatase maturation enzyme AslB (radical SAM superfamily)
VTVVPGSYKKTRAGLERLVAQRKIFSGKYPLIHLTCVISSGNAMDLVPLYDYAEKLGVNVCNFVLQNPATYWHAKDYDQDNHLLKKPPLIEEIDSKILKGQLDLLLAREKTYSSQLRFSPNYITPDEIVRYYSNQSSYKDYRCYTPWTKMAFSAYGDIFSCPHYRLGSFNNEGNISPWNGERSREFRERIKNEKIFPGCLGCCQSEYIGSEK